MAIMMTLCRAGGMTASAQGHKALAPNSARPPVPTAPEPTASSRDQVCAGCHQAIYDSYERTSMALGSGPITPENPPSGNFEHTPSSILYRVFRRDGSAWMSYSRQAKTLQMFDIGHVSATGRAAAPLQGEHRLEYFIGSGKHGRTYLYKVDGTWFELPINYYTRRAAWGMAPAFDQAATMPADLPADPSCLHCHATGIASPSPGSRSHYPGPPFAQGGIGCSACHGDPTAHLVAGGHAPILNPGKLDPARRDGACLSCHLEGDAVVFLPGKSLAQFQPGDDLTKMAVFFVRANAAGGGGRAGSQYEALLRSACKRAAGDRLTCTTCHDPHSSPAPAERIAYYRSKCLGCHTGASMATAHHPEQPDCVHCHMPNRSTTDISHEQSVDHDIERIPSPPAANGPRIGETLIPVGDWKSSDRELGMAYAQLAAKGDRQAGERALGLLVRAEASGANDPAMHAQLGLLRQLSGDRAQARSEYLMALQQNPLEPSALANLAVLDAGTGDVTTAVTLLNRLVSADPTQTSAGLNLAFIECRLGEPGDALALLARLAHYNPDDPALYNLQATGSYNGQHCDLLRGGSSHAQN